VLCRLDPGASDAAASRALAAALALKIEDKRVDACVLYYARCVAERFPSFFLYVSTA
jgi:hypothetical protein